MNILKISGPIKVGALASAPANPEVGYIYYNTTTSSFQLYTGAGFVEPADFTQLLSVTGAAAIGLDNAGLTNVPTATTVQAGIEELDTAIGVIDTTPTNYAPASPSVVASHLAAIDSALTTSGSTDFADNVFRISDNTNNTKKMAFEVSAVATATTRTITVPNTNVNLADIATNTQNISDAQTDINDLVTLSGVAANATNLGTFTGVTIPDSQTVKQALQALETEVETRIDSSEKAQPNGVASLDSNGKVPVAQLPNSVMEYQGAWNASTNSPTLADGVGNAGDVYRVSVAGTQNLGSGSVTYKVGDFVVYNGTIWQRSPASDAPVQSVNGQQGVVVLDTDDISEGTTNLYFTNARAQAATISQVITNGVTTKAPSEDAVFDALALKLANVVEDTDPSLGGDLNLNNNALLGNLQRAAVASPNDFIEEQYVHATALAANQTNTVITALTFAHATVQGLEITYSIKEATSNDVRIGTIRVVTNGTAVAINDIFTETADTGVSFSAVVNGSNINVRYSSGTNAATLRMDVKRILV